MTRTRSTLLLSACFAAAASTAACHPKPIASMHMGTNGGVHVQTQEPMEGAVTVADRLECPTAIGALTRTAASADGASCDYTSDKGTVHLAYAAGADPKTAVASLKGQLDAELPGVAEKATIQVVSEKDANGQEHTKVDMPFIHVQDDGKGTDGNKRTKVDMPFLHVEETGDGRSHVRLMGINIESNDHHGRRHHRNDADKDDATETTTGNTTAASTANATPPEKRGVELVYVLVSGKPSAQGFHVAGYVAKGPPQGKLVVATFHYKSDRSFNSDNRRHNDDDIDKLMSLNVKPA